MAEKKNIQSVKEQQIGEAIFAGYKGGEEMPLGSYAILLGIYKRGVSRVADGGA